MSRLVCVLAFALSVLLASLAFSDEVDDLLKDIRAVGAEGAGSARARVAWDRLVRQGPRVLPRLLAAMDTPDAVASNWLRLAFDEIVAADEKAVDVDALLAFAR